MRDIIIYIYILLDLVLEPMFWVNNNKDVKQTVVKYISDGRYVII